MEQRAFLWPRMVAVIRATAALPAGLDSLLTAHGIDCTRIDDHNLVADISHLQVHDGATGSTERAVARLQHLLNLKVSPLNYALGIGSDNVWAYHAAQLVGRGQEKWILPWQVEAEIGHVPVSALHVIDRHMPEFFHACGKRDCSELLEFGKEFLVRRFGNAGEMLWCLLRGKYCQLPTQQQLPDGNIRWQLSLPVRTHSRRALSAHLWRLYSMVNRNLDRLHRQAQRLELQYHGPEHTGFDQPAVRLQTHLRRRRELNRHVDRLNIDKAGVAHLQITALQLSHPAGQLELF